MKTEIFFILFISIISGSVFATDMVKNPNDIGSNSPYKNAKLHHEILTKEMKEIDRQIEKTKAIECSTPFGRFISGFLNLLPFSNFFKNILVCSDRKCEAEKQSQLVKLMEKKNAKQAQISKAHKAITELHPMQGRNLKEENVQKQPEVTTESQLVGGEDVLTTANMTETLEMTQKMEATQKPEVTKIPEVTKKPVMPKKLG